MTRMRSTVGLKSKPNAVPLSCERAGAAYLVGCPGRRIDQVETAAAPQAIEHLIGRPAVDAEQRLARLQSGHAHCREDRAGGGAVSESASFRPE